MPTTNPNFNRVEGEPAPEALGGAERRQPPVAIAIAVAEVVVAAVVAADAVQAVVVADITAAVAVGAEGGKRCRK